MRVTKVRDFTRVFSTYIPLPTPKTPEDVEFVLFLHVLVGRSLVVARRRLELGLFGHFGDGTSRGSCKDATR